VTAPFEEVSLDTLRARRSEKWTTHPADVLPAWVAEMDVALAPAIRKALIEAIERGDTGYASGRPTALYEAFAGFAADELGFAVDPARLVLVPDVTAGVAEVLRLLTPPDSGVVVDTPAYPPFFPTIPEFGRRVVPVPGLMTERGFAPDLDGLERAFRAGARAYLLCNPHNPTGRVLTRAELAAIAELAERHGVVVVSDENHAPLTLPGATHTPFVALDAPVVERSVTVISAAKAWNLAGLKCALVVAGSEALRARLATLPAEVQTRAGHLGVLAATVAFRDARGWLREVVAYLDRNRALVAELLAEKLPEVGYVPPQASFLAWLDCRRLGLGDDPAAAFLAHGRVALSRGLDFGPEGAGFARLNFGTSRALLEEAVTRMAAAGSACRRSSGSRIL
jgi:cysteine-S-conjugate beta-lyase